MIDLDIILCHSCACAQVVRYFGSDKGGGHFLPHYDEHPDCLTRRVRKAPRLESIEPVLDELPKSKKNKKN